MLSYLALVRLNLLATTTAMALLIVFYNLGGVSGVEIAMLVLLLINALFYAANLKQIRSVLTSIKRLINPSGRKSGEQSDPSTLRNNGIGEETIPGSSIATLTNASGLLIATAREMLQMSELLETAVTDARNAAQAAERARVAAEQIREQSTEDYASLRLLAEGVQRKIAALALLARPMPPAASPAEHAEIVDM